MLERTMVDEQSHTVL